MVREKSLSSLRPRREAPPAPLVTIYRKRSLNNLVESELFGTQRCVHRSPEQRAALVAARGEGGTLFLDEVGESRWRCSGEAARLLQQREYTPLGETRSNRCVSSRATNRRAPDEEVKAGRFREISITAST